MDDYKIEVEERIVQKMITAVGEGVLTEEQLPEIATFVLDHLTPVTNQDQLIGFLHTISLKWPLFVGIATSEEGILKKGIEQGIVSNMLVLIKEGDFQKAVNLAHQVTE